MLKMGGGCCWVAGEVEINLLRLEVTGCVA
jgi:hypothetical protein